MGAQVRLFVHLRSDRKMPHKWWIFRHLLGSDGGFFARKRELVLGIQEKLTALFSAES